MHYMLESKALFFYPVKPLYETSYETYQMFFLIHSVLKQNIWEVSYEDWTR